MVATRSYAEVIGHLLLDLLRLFVLGVLLLHRLRTGFLFVLHRLNIHFDVRVVGPCGDFVGMKRCGQMRRQEEMRL